MKVNEFAKRLGLKDSKVRYYDRMGLIQGQRCEENNYREFNALDALTIYHAQMLRSFDMSIQESLFAKQEDLNHIDSWINNHVQILEENIRFEEIKIHRLREMQEYFKILKNTRTNIHPYQRDTSFNCWSFYNAKEFTKEKEEAMEILANAMPFSYVAIKVGKEIFHDPKQELQVSIGLGILEKNRQILGLEFNDEVEVKKGSGIIQIVIESPDPFHLTKEDLKPIYELIEEKQLQITQDIIGRIYLSCFRNQQFVHLVGLGIEVN